jgi:hypothetical protein
VLKCYLKNIKRFLILKGIVFTQLLEMVEEKFGFDISDEILERANLEGLYTQAGNYPFAELYKIIKELSTTTNTPINDLIVEYGKYLFPKLIGLYPHSVLAYKSSFEFIANVEKVIHPEVKKLYPDSVLPSFDLISVDEKKMELMYNSNKPLMDFAKGLMIGCAEYYNENTEVSYKTLESDSNQFRAIFTIKKID